MYSQVYILVYCLEIPQSGAVKAKKAGSNSILHPVDNYSVNIVTGSMLKGLCEAGCWITTICKCKRYYTPYITRYTLSMRIVLVTAF